MPVWIVHVTDRVGLLTEIVAIHTDKDQAVKESYKSEYGSYDGPYPSGKFKVGQILTIAELEGL